MLNLSLPNIDKNKAKKILKSLKHFSFGADAGTSYFSWISVKNVVALISLRAFGPNWFNLDYKSLLIEHPSTSGVIPVRIERIDEGIDLEQINKVFNDLVEESEDFSYKYYFENKGGDPREAYKEFLIKKGIANKVVYEDSKRRKLVIEKVNYPLDFLKFIYDPKEGTLYKVVNEKGKRKLVPISP